MSDLAHADFIVPPTLLTDGREAAIIPLTFGRARIVVSKAGDRVGYEDGW